MTKSNVAGRRGRRLNLKQREALTGWLFVSPALIGFGIFTFGAMTICLISFIHHAAFIKIYIFYFIL